eukprot:jgi/Chlat1/8109/Chrsp75S07569
MAEALVGAFRRSAEAFRRHVAGLTEEQAATAVRALRSRAVLDAGDGGKRAQLLLRALLSSPRLRGETALVALSLLQHGVFTGLVASCIIIDIRAWLLYGAWSPSRIDGATTEACADEPLLIVPHTETHGPESHSSEEDMVTLPEYVRVSKAVLRALEWRDKQDAACAGDDAERQPLQYEGCAGCWEVFPSAVSAVQRLHDCSGCCDTDSGKADTHEERLPQIHAACPVTEATFAITQELLSSPWQTQMLPSMLTAFSELPRELVWALSEPICWRVEAQADLICSNKDFLRCSPALLQLAAVSQQPRYSVCWCILLQAAPPLSRLSFFTSLQAALQSGSQLRGVMLEALTSQSPELKSSYQAKQSAWLECALLLVMDESCLHTVAAALDCKHCTDWGMVVKDLLAVHAGMADYLAQVGIALAVAGCAAAQPLVLQLFREQPALQPRLLHQALELVASARTDKVGLLLLEALCSEMSPGAASSFWAELLAVTSHMLQSKAARLWGLALGKAPAVEEAMPVLQALASRQPVVAGICMSNILSRVSTSYQVRLVDAFEATVTSSPNSRCEVLVGLANALHSAGPMTAELTEALQAMLMRQLLPGVTLAGPSAKTKIATACSPPVKFIIEALYRQTNGHAVLALPIPAVVYCLLRTITITCKETPIAVERAVSGILQQLCSLDSLLALLLPSVSTCDTVTSPEPLYKRLARAAQLGSTAPGLELGQNEQTCPLEQITFEKRAALVCELVEVFLEGLLAEPSLATCLHASPCASSVPLQLAGIHAVLSKAAISTRKASAQLSTTAMAQLLETAAASSNLVTSECLTHILDMLTTRLSLSTSSDVKDSAVTAAHLAFKLLHCSSAPDGLQLRQLPVPDTFASSLAAYATAQLVKTVRRSSSPLKADRCRRSSGRGAILAEASNLADTAAVHQAAISLLAMSFLSSSHGLDEPMSAWFRLLSSIPMEYRPASAIAVEQAIAEQHVGFEVQPGVESAEQVVGETAVHIANVAQAAVHRGLPVSVLEGYCKLFVMLFKSSTPSSRYAHSVATVLLDLLQHQLLSQDGLLRTVLRTVLVLLNTESAVKVAMEVVRSVGSTFGNNKESSGCVQPPVLLAGNSSCVLAALSVSLHCMLRLAFQPLEQLTAVADIESLPVATHCLKVMAEACTAATTFPAPAVGLLLRACCKAIAACTIAVEQLLEVFLQTVEGAEEDRSSSSTASSLQAASTAVTDARHQLQAPLAFIAEVNALAVAAGSLVLQTASSQRPSACASVHDTVVVFARMCTELKQACLQSCSSSMHDQISSCCATSTASVRKSKKIPSQLAAGSSVVGFIDIELSHLAVSTATLLSDLEQQLVAQPKASCSHESSETDTKPDLPFNTAPDASHVKEVQLSAAQFVVGGADIRLSSRRKRKRKSLRSQNPFIDAALQSNDEQASDDDYSDLADFIVCKPGKVYS